jgi:hypothetical protein
MASCQIAFSLHFQKLKAKGSYPEVLHPLWQGTYSTILEVQSEMAFHHFDKVPNQPIIHHDVSLSMPEPNVTDVLVSDLPIFHNPES